MKEIIKASNVSKVYNQGTNAAVQAIKRVDLTIYEGEFVAIMGPSGAGKSTLLNVLTTIDTPTTGEIMIDDVNISLMDEKKRSEFRYKELGFIYQDYNLLENLTIYENIALSLTMTKESKAEIERRVNQVAERLEVSELLDKYPNECSGGQQQRVAIARTLAIAPKLIVADEPTGNLDSKNSNEVMKLLVQLNKNETTTLLIVTHDSMVASYAKKMLYINDGVIEEELLRGNQTKKEFFNAIVDINSKEIFIEDLL